MPFACDPLSGLMMKIDSDSDEHNDDDDDDDDDEDDDDDDACVRLSSSSAASSVLLPTLARFSASMTALTFVSSMGKHQDSGTNEYCVGNRCFILPKRRAIRTFRLSSMIPGKWFMCWCGSSSHNVLHEID